MGMVPSLFGGWKQLLGLWATLSVIVFLITWMGYGNSTFPQGWGDPIDALAAVPRILTGLFVALLLVVALTGLRSGD